MFGNDDAVDWLNELVDGDDEQLVADMLERATGDEDLEAPKGSQALAAAEIVAAAADAPPESNSYNEQALAWPAGHRELAMLIPVAIQAIDRVTADDSELAELWAEADDPAWANTVSELRKRLRRRS